MLTRVLARIIWRYWGYLLLVVLAVAWNTKAGPGVLLAISLGEILYFLFWAPAWCGAVTRSGLPCRNNSTGLLLGCHLREHKYQRLKGVVFGHAWRRMTDGLFATPSATIATLGVLAGIASAVASIVGVIRS